MIKRSDYTIIYPPSIPWHNMRQRPQCLCKALATLGYKVIFCDSMIIRDGKVVKIGDFPETGGELYISYNPRAIAKVFPKDQNICFFSYAKTAQHGELFNSIFNIWDYLDDFWQNRVYDPMAYKNADAISTTAKVLQEKAMAQFSGPIKFIQNACSAEEFERFGHSEVKKSARREGRKYKLYYIGAVASWLMWQDIIEFAKENEDILDIYMIGGRFFYGGEFDGVPLDIILEPITNIHELGHVPYDKLHAHFEEADGFWIPFLPPHKLDRANEGLAPTTPEIAELITTNRNYADLMRATNPIKFFEYLATGKPIMTSSLPEVVRIVEENELQGVFFADTAEEMTTTLKHNLYQGYTLYQGHRDFAEVNTWDHRAKDLDKLIQGLIMSGVDRRAGRKITQLI